MSFKYRFILSFVILEVFFILLIVIFNFIAITDSSKKLIDEKIDSNISFLEKLLVIPLSIYDLATLDNITKNTAELKYINSIIIIDNENKIVSSEYKFKHKNIEEILKIKSNEDLLFEDEIYELRYKEFREDKIYIGAIYVIFDHSKNRIFLNETKNNNVILILIEILISTLLSFLIGNKLNEKLINLSEVAINIGKNKKIRIPYLELNDEIGILSKSLNQMHINLQNRNEKLKKLTKDLVTERSKLIETQKYKDLFFANMSHELKTPLNSINILSSIMMNNKKKNLDEVQVKNLTIINDCGNKLIGLINDIMDISKIEAGELIVNSKLFDFNESIDKIYEMFLMQTQKKGLEFIFKKDSSIEVISNDEKLIGQILINLLSNAIKFTDKGKIVFTINNKDEFIEFIVKDEGIGISSNKLEHIFERFKQVDGSISRKYGGTGLGLSISKELANILSGDITVRSKLGEGSEFTVLIKKNFTKQDINMSKIMQNKDDKFNFQNSKQAQKKENQNIIILNNDSLYYFDIVLKLRKKDITVKQISSFESLIQELQGKNQSYDKIVIDMDFSSDFTNEEIFREFLENNKTRLVLVSHQVEKMNEHIKNNIKNIIEKSQKNKLNEILELS